MVRFWTLWVLGLCLFSQSLTAREIAGEWILTIDAPRNWEKVLKSLRGGAQFIRFVGQRRQHALIRTHRKFPRLFRLPRGFIKAWQPNFRYRNLESQDPYFDVSWALRNQGQAISSWGKGVSGRDLNVLGAWKYATGSQSIKIAILDTGIKWNHEDLLQNLRPVSNELTPNGKDDDGNGWIDDPLGWNFINQTAFPFDDNGHGTFCSGIIGADWKNEKGSRGVLENTSLLPVKILDHLGQGSTATAIEGIEYAVSSGAEVINMSWGGDRFDTALYHSMKEAAQKGVLFVAAAGNSSGNNDDPSESVYPASFSIPGLISVAAYDPKGERASFSQFGKQRVHIGAPGVAILGPELEGYGFRSGTSFAAPFVTGVAALVKSKMPQLSGETLKTRILKTGEPLHHYEKYYTESGSLVNAENALLGKEPSQNEVPLKWQRRSSYFESEHPYRPHTFSSKKVVEPGARYLRIHFKKFETEKKFDWVTLKDKNGKIVYRYSGALSPFTSFEAEGDEIEVEFSSDYNRQLHGFEIDYIEAAF